MQLEHRLPALLQLHLHSRLNTWLQWIGQRHCNTWRETFKLWLFGASYIRDFTVVHHTHPNSNGGWIELPLNLWHGWAITYHRNYRTQLLIHVPIPNNPRRKASVVNHPSTRQCHVNLEHFEPIVRTGCFWRHMHSLSFLNIKIIQVFQIRLHRWQRAFYLIRSTSKLFMIWRSE